MSDTSLHPREAILRLCEAAAPEPWYPRWHAATAGLDLGRLKGYIEDLWLEGLLEHTPGTKDSGPGLVLSPRGREVLNDPEALQRLREGQPLGGTNRAAIIRRAFLHPTRPYVTQLLLLANFAFFGYTLYLASQKGLTRPFLTAMPGMAPALAQRIVPLVHASGSVHPLDVIGGQWWRLATANFVHLGLLHILMNMYGLYVAGRFVEQMWGHWRYLLIYAVAGLGSICMGLAYNQPADNMGASGPLCGILGADAVWLLLNGKYLPRSLARRGRTGLLTTFILLVVISMIPGVSGWGHLGGVLWGAGAALLLQIQRFARPPLSWLAIVGLVPLCWLAVALLDHARATSPIWRRLEEHVEAQRRQQELRDFEKRYTRRIDRTLRDARRMQRERVEDLLNRHPTRRDRARVEEMLPELAREQERLNTLADELSHIGPYHDELAEEARKTARDCAREWAVWYETAARCLREGPRWKDTQEDQFREQTKRVRELWDKWRSLFK